MGTILRIPPTSPTFTLVSLSCCNLYTFDELYLSFSLLPYLLSALFSWLRFETWTWWIRLLYPFPPLTRCVMVLLYRSDARPKREGGDVLPESSSCPSSIVTFDCFPVLRCTIVGSFLLFGVEDDAELQVSSLWNNAAVYFIWVTGV